MLLPRTAEVPMNFAALVEVLLADYYRLQPDDATGLGFHEHDDRWPDLTDAGHAEWSAWLAGAGARRRSTGESCSTTWPPCASPRTNWATTPGTRCRTCTSSAGRSSPCCPPSTPPRPIDCARGGGAP